MIHHHCGKPGHLVTVCRFRDSVCHKCTNFGGDIYLKYVGAKHKLNPPHKEGLGLGELLRIHNWFAKLTKSPILTQMTPCSPLSKDKMATHPQ